MKVAESKDFAFFTKRKSVCLANIEKQGERRIVISRSRPLSSESEKDSLRNISKHRDSNFM